MKDELITEVGIKKFAQWKKTALSKADFSRKVILSFCVLLTDILGTFSGFCASLSQVLKGMYSEASK